MLSFNFFNWFGGRGGILTRGLHDANVAITIEEHFYFWLCLLIFRRMMRRH